jgi:hypothetical protein
VPRQRAAVHLAVRFDSTSKAPKTLAIPLISAAWHVSAWKLPYGRAKGGDVAQRFVEMLIGRLMTDEQLRDQFLRDAKRLLQSLLEGGLELSRTEMSALIETDRPIWARTAGAIDPRLQKVNLEPVGEAPAEENRHV